MLPWLPQSGLLAASISPLTVLLASIGMFAFLAIARQMNFNKIVMMMKSWAKNISRIRFEIRAKLHTGFRDYSDSWTARDHTAETAASPDKTNFFILF